MTKHDPPGDVGKAKKTAQKSSEAVKKDLQKSAKHTFVVMHVDQRYSVSPPQPTNCEEALKIVAGVPKRARCANCILHVFVSRENGKWKVKSVAVRR